MKKFFFVLICSFCVNLIQAQITPRETQTQREHNERSSPKKFGERLVYTGNVSLVFGNQTFIGADPGIGYKVNDWLVAGFGGHYYYMQVAGRSNRVYGGQLFSQARVYEGFFAMSTFQMSNTRVFSQLSPNDELRDRDVWVPHWYVGGGYFPQAGGRIRVGASILFDLIQDPNSPWPNPNYSVGMIYGF
jgi:hypothetical protein